MLIVLLSLICRSIARERILLGLVLTGSDCASLGSIDSIRDQCCRIFFIFCVLFSCVGLPQVPQLRVIEVITSGWLAGIEW